MLKKTVQKDGTVKVTFVVEGDNPMVPCAVAGEFNAWNPEANKLMKRSNGTYSASVALAADSQFRFRYVTPDGQWFNDEAADDYVTGEAGEPDCVVRT